MDVLTELTVLIISQYIHVSPHRAVNLNLHLLCQRYLNKARKNQLHLFLKSDCQQSIIKNK